MDCMDHGVANGGSESKESGYNVEDPGSIPGQGDPLEKGMATHSGILAWIISWTAESGRLQSMGSATTEVTEQARRHTGAQ